MFLRTGQRDPGTVLRLMLTFAAVRGEAARCSCDGATDARRRPLARRRPPALR